MNSTELSNVIYEKEFDVTVSKDLKPSKHCSDVVKIGNKLIGFIGRTFEYKSEKGLSQHYFMCLRDIIAASFGHHNMENILLIC